MIESLAEVAKRLRKDAGRKPHHIAAAIDVDPTTIYRFEQGKWPRDTDEMLAGYEKETGVSATKMWAEALRLQLVADDPGKAWDGLLAEVQSEPPKPRPSARRARASEGK